MDNVGQPVSEEDMLLWRCEPAGVPVLLQEGCDKVYYKSSSGCRAIKPREVLHGPGVHAGGRGFAKVEGHVGGARGAGAGRRASRPSRSRTLANFGQAETPDKTVLPDDYKAETGCTPPTDRGDVVYHHRLNYRRPGVPGESSDNAFCLGTPKRQKSGD